MADKTEKPRFVVEPINPKHDRTATSRGVKILDTYLYKQADQGLKKHTAVPFEITPDGRTIASTYTRSQYAVQLDEIPTDVAIRLPKYPIVPATLLGRLAVSNAFRRQGLGSTPLMDALYRTLHHSGAVASAGVIIDAQDAAALAFCKKYGFLELTRIERRLFLPMGTAKDLFR